MAKTIGPLNWFGGKAQLAPWIMAHFPTHQRYVEVFGGAAAVLFTKRASPIEIYNDVDAGLVGFFRVLRDPVLFPEFFRRVQLMPYSRAEFHHCRAQWQVPDDPIEQAVRWYAVARWSFSGNWGTSWGYDLSESSPRGAAHVSRWLAAIDMLPAFHQRMMRVIVEMDDWRLVMDRYDGPEALLYCDPPYVPDTRKAGTYQHELTQGDHEDLIQRLLACRGMVIVSGYDHPLYAPLMEAGWRQVTKTVALRSINQRTTIAQTRREVLWINPAAQRRQAQITFDDVWKEVGTCGTNPTDVAVAAQCQSSDHRGSDGSPG